MKIQGGCVDDICLWVEDEPEFVLGEKALLFLNNEGKAKHFIVNSRFQGKYTIEGNITINKELNRNISVDGFINAIQQRNKKITYDVEDSLKGNVGINSATASSSCYVYSGYKWAPQNWGVKVPFYKNNNLNNLPGDWNTAINKGAGAWNGAAQFTFLNYGRTSKSCYSQDGYNTVCYTDDLGGCGQGATVAQARIWLKYSWFGAIVEADMKFNDKCDWYAGTDNPCNKFDVWNVATHEFGHWLKLNHPNDIGQQCNQESMWSGTSPGETLRRDIYDGDLAGIRYLYGQ